jgi:DNA mismatch endonuclease (patch repair protein)
MADRLTVNERSKLMSKIKNKNTNIEVLVRKWLFSRGFRYRINVKKLPGSPDIVLHKYKCVIFVNGCFWHGHNCPDGHIPKSNVEFWKNKIERNQERDLKCKQELESLGWRVIILWECELKDFETIMAKLERNIRNCYS